MSAFATMLPHGRPSAFVVAGIFVATAAVTHVFPLGARKALDRGVARLEPGMARAVVAAAMGMEPGPGTWGGGSETFGIWGFLPGDRVDCTVFYDEDDLVSAVISSGDTPLLEGWGWSGSTVTVIE